MPSVKCPRHQVVLICPICSGHEGGNATLKKYGKKQMQSWGKLGGRPKGRKDSKPRKRRGGSENQ